MGPALTLVQALAGWLAAGQSAWLATLTAVDGSAPEPVGAMMAVGPGGQVVGSIGGGCVDGAVLAETERPGQQSRQLSYSHDDGPWAAGPSCGGRLHVLLEHFTPEDQLDWYQIMVDLRLGLAVARLRVMPGGNSVLIRRFCGPPAGWEWPALPVPDIAAVVEGMLHKAVRDAAPQAAMPGNGKVLAQLWPSPPRLILIGADSVATHLTELATAIGFAVTVCDPRPLFATQARFPHARHVVTAWPQQYFADEAAAGRIGPDTAVCVLTHDERVDLPTLTAVLNGPPLSYVGALGSRATQQRRHQDLTEAGISPGALRRLHGPAGLDLRGIGPAAIALSILAEITAVRHGGSGLPLRDLTGRLHQHTP